MDEACSRLTRGEYSALLQTFCYEKRRSLIPFVDLATFDLSIYLRRAWCIPRVRACNWATQGEYSALLDTPPYSCVKLMFC